MSQKIIYSRIIGTGSYLPPRIVSNAELAETVDTTDEWIVSRTGIKQRHLINPKTDEGTNFMAIQAAKKALEAASLKAAEIDLIIVASCSPDYTFPSVACFVQKELGIHNKSPAFDITAACSGFIYSLSVADLMIKSGGVKNALVIGAESISRFINWEDRSTCVLFGDGAGAIILQASQAPGIYSTHLHAAGEHTDLLYAERPYGGTENNCHIHMQGNPIFKLAVTELSDAVKETLEKNNVQPEQLDWLVPHQANLRIIQAIAERLNMSMEKVVCTVDKHANTSAASIPLALDVAVRDGRIKRGQLILLEAFGGGLTWGSALIKY
jgi:3-oxoacyl-[acyl-carrier-protein] synthase-3